MTEFWYILYMKLVSIPTVPAAKDYLISNFGPEPISLGEGNEYYWILATEYPYEPKSLSKSYCENLQVLLPIDTPLTKCAVMHFNQFALQRIHHLYQFKCTSRPSNKRTEILLDVLSENNLDLSMYSTLKSGLYRTINRVKDA